MRVDGSKRHSALMTRTVVISMVTPDLCKTFKVKGKSRVQHGLVNGEVFRVVEKRTVTFLEL